MPTGLVLNKIYKCLVDGTGVFTSTDLTQNEHLEDLATMVVDVEIVNFPDPATVASGLDFQIIRTDAVTAMGSEQFTGTLNSKDAVGFPNRVKLSATGELAKLRRAPLGDHVLTGMTDITAARAILTACDVTYTSGDIDGFGYTLGGVKPVIWKKGVTGLTMLQELDRVFACATIEIGSGRIVRFVYDRVPSLGDASVTYVKGVTLAYHGAERKIGDIEAIQNFWQVGGLSYTSNHDGTPAASGASNTCQAKYWGSAYAVNSKISGYSSPQDFSSDLIQSEGLAKQIAARLMRWWNREPDTVTIEAVNDPQVVPGLVVSLTDNSYGVDLATATPYLILGIDRTFTTMKLACIGGAAGATGTVKSGLNVCCGTQQADGTCVENGLNGGVGAWPAPGFPPFPAFASFAVPTFPAFDLSLGALVCPVCDDSTLGALPGTDWALKAGTTGPWDFSANCLIAHGAAPTHNVFWAVTNTVTGKFPIAGDKLVQFKGHVSWLGGEPNLITGTSSAYLTLGLLSPDGSHDSLLVQYLFNSGGGSAVSFAGSVGGAGNPSGDYSIPFETNPQEFDFFILWDPTNAGNYSITLTGGVEFSVSGTGADLTGGVGSVLFNSWTDATAAPTLDVMLSCLEYQQTSGGLSLGTWHLVDGNMSAGSDFVHLINTTPPILSSNAYATGADFPLDGSQRFRWAGTISFSAGSALAQDFIFSIGLGPDITTPSFFRIFFQSEYAGQGFDEMSAPDHDASMQTMDDYLDDCTGVGVCGGFNPQPGFTFLFDVDPGAGHAQLTLNGTVWGTIALSTWPGPLWPMIALDNRADVSVDLAMDDIVFTVG